MLRKVQDTQPEPIPLSSGGMSKEEASTFSVEYVLGYEVDGNTIEGYGRLYDVDNSAGEMMKKLTARIANHGEAHIRAMGGRCLQQGFYEWRTGCDGAYHSNSGGRLLDAFVKEVNDQACGIAEHRILDILPPERRQKEARPETER